MWYVGIGSRKTPKEVCSQFTSIARRLAEQQWWLRTGGAPGADKAFEKGVQISSESHRLQVITPWQGFNNTLDTHEYILNRMSLTVKTTAEQYVRYNHPQGRHLKPAALKLLARNYIIINGVWLDEPPEFIICWTKGGGGTGFALEIARRMAPGALIINFHDSNYMEVLKKTEKRYSIKIL